MYILAIQLLGQFNIENHSNSVFDIFCVLILEHSGKHNEKVVFLQEWK